ncbi:MAG: dihydroorotase family protein [Clostridiales bacterium]
MRQVISSDDIWNLVQGGKTTLHLEGEYVLTDIARDMVKRYGIAIAGPAPGKIAAMAGKSEGADFARGLGQAFRMDKEMTAAGALNQADLLITNGRIVLPEAGVIEGGLAIKDGKILAIMAPDAVCPAERLLDAGGNYVLPGIIDPHVHLGMFAPLEEELATESHSALMGGVTTMGCFFNQKESYRRFLEDLTGQVAQYSGADLFPHLTLREQVHLEELNLYRTKGVSSFKTYMCGIPGILPHQSDGFIVAAMQSLKTLPGEPVLCVHCENTSLVDAALEQAAALPKLDLRQWGATHPAMAEEEALIRAAYFASKIGINLYAVHISTKDAIETARSIKGPRIHIETTSPYLSLDDSTTAGVDAKMAPPIRDQASREALWQGIITGTVDTIGTDNVTMTRAEKQVEKGVAGAIPGYPAMATHLVSVLDGAIRRGIPLEMVIAKMTLNPAKIFGIYPRKGTLLPGSDADLVIVDPCREQAVDPGTLGSRSDFSLFTGRTLRGWPVATIKGGELVCQNGQMVSAARGSFLIR